MAPHKAEVDQCPSPHNSLGAHWRKSLMLSLRLFAAAQANR
ncbi:hypothetical protein ACKFKF_15790 [Phormidesmis sp. 146-12]